MLGSTECGPILVSPPGGDPREGLKPLEGCNLKFTPVHMAQEDTKGAPLLLEAVVAPEFCGPTGRATLEAKS